MSSPRRRFLIGFLASFAGPAASRAQGLRVARVGLLDPTVPSPMRDPLWDAFRQRLRELGYRDGRATD